MGGGMARRLLTSGYPVVGYNRSPARTAALQRDGASIASSPRTAAEGAAVVFSMVADDVASRAMWLGQEGALAGAAAGTVVVECSTLSVGWVNELARAVAGAGGRFLDAPVTGSKQAAAAGELNFIVGGSSDDLAMVQPAFMAMGKRVVHVGPTGSGALVKLVNNFLAGVQVAALAEAFAWMERTDLDRAKAVSFLMEGAAASPVTKVVAERIIAADFSPNFLLRLMAKDLGYAIDEARGKNLSLQTAGTALNRFREAISDGQGDEDMAAVVKAIRAAKA
jgi:3-hydroxyisobutyrate dehydrogenase